MNAKQFYSLTVIANEVKQSMTPEAMDRHATLAMTVRTQRAVPDRTRETRDDGNFYGLNHI